MKPSKTRAVAGGQTPDPFAVAGEAAGIRNAVGALSQGRAARVFKIVDPFSTDIIIGDAAKIDPALGILVPEERREMNETLAIIGFPFVTARPFSPAIPRERIGRSAKTQQVQNHGFVVADPTALDEPGFGMPAHRECVATA